MDYMKELDYRLYENWDDFTKQNPSNNYYYMTRYGKQAPSQIDFTQCEGDIYLVLGKESTGIPKADFSQTIGSLYATAYGGQCAKP